MSQFKIQSSVLSKGQTRLRMITRKQIIPLLLEACPSFGNIWGPIQRPDEDQYIYVAFGAFASHFRGLYESGNTSEFRSFNEVVKRFQEEGDAEVRQLGAELIQNVKSHLVDENTI